MGDLSVFWVVIGGLVGVALAPWITLPFIMALNRWTHVAPLPAPPIRWTDPDYYARLRKKDRRVADILDAPQQDDVEMVRRAMKVTNGQS